MEVTLRRWGAENLFLQSIRTLCPAFALASAWKGGPAFLSRGVPTILLTYLKYPLLHEALTYFYPESFILNFMHSTSQFVLAWIFAFILCYGSATQTVIKSLAARDRLPGFKPQLYHWLQHKAELLGRKRSHALGLPFSGQWLLESCCVEPWGFWKVQFANYWSTSLTPLFLHMRARCVGYW